MKTLFDMIERLTKAGYPESTARKIATGELPMDVDSRMDRAMDQGFDIDRLYYHGTDQDILEFDPSRIGQGKGKTPATLPQGFYFARSPDTASEYATGEGANIIPVFLKTEDLMTRGDLQAFKDFNAGEGDSLLSRSGEVMIVRNPEQIRSQSAAFDPDNVGKPNIMGGAASVGVGGLLGALGLPQDATAADIIFAKAPELSEQGEKEVKQLLLDALMGFMAPAELGDATMYGNEYDRPRKR
jgi:hypothetical protein